MVNIPNIRYFQYYGLRVSGPGSHANDIERNERCWRRFHPLSWFNDVEVDRPLALGIGRRATGQRVSAIDRYLGPLSRTPPSGCTARLSATTRTECRRIGGSRVTTLTPPARIQWCRTRTGGLIQALISGRRCRCSRRRSAPSSSGRGACARSPRSGAPPVHRGTS